MNKILNGYKNLFTKVLNILKSTGTLAIFILIIVAISIAIVYPLWLFATKSSENYTIFVSITTGILVVLYILYKIYHLIKLHGISTELKDKFIQLTIKIVKIIVIIFIIFSLVFVFTRYTILQTLLYLFILLLLYGLFNFGLKK